MQIYASSHAPSITANVMGDFNTEVISWPGNDGKDSNEDRPKKDVMRGQDAFVYLADFDRAGHNNHGLTERQRRVAARHVKQAIRKTYGNDNPSPSDWDEANAHLWKALEFIEEGMVIEWLERDMEGKEAQASDKDGKNLAG